MHTEFYDIESLDNIFTCSSWYPSKKLVNVYVIDDDNTLSNSESWVETHEKKTLAECDKDAHDKVVARIKEKNPRLESLLAQVSTGATTPDDLEINIIDLKNIDGLADFMREFCICDTASRAAGMCIANESVYVQNDMKGYEILKLWPNAKVDPETTYRGIVRDTDDLDENDEDTPYILGYNSFNYDSTMLAYVAWNMFVRWIKYDNNKCTKPGHIEEATAHSIRKFNNLLFSDQFKSNMSDGAKVIADHAKSEHMAKIRDRRQKDAVKTVSDFISDNDVSVPDLNLGNLFLSHTPLSELRKETLSTGRHIDVARLNEKQRKVGLKRLLGMIGAQILESEKLHGDDTHVGSFDDALELIAYNVSDIVGLQLLFEINVYASGFDLKRNMLKTYPELVYDTDRSALRKAMSSEMTPEKAREASTRLLGQQKNKVLPNRLYSDASSQQLASRALSPLGPLVDKPSVSLLYPDDSKVDGQLKNVTDVLEDARKFFENDVLSIIDNPEARAKAKENFMHVYRAYRRIIGFNFDESKTYAENFDYGPTGDKQEIFARRIGEVAADLPWSMPYYDGNGHETTCFATFSTGGLHGAELNKELYDADLAEFQKAYDAMQAAKAIYGDDEAGAVNLRNSLKKGSDPVNLGDYDDGTVYHAKDFLRSGFTKSKAFWKELKRPELFSKTVVNVQRVDEQGRRIWSHKRNGTEWHELDQMDMLVYTQSTIQAFRIPDKFNLQRYMDAWQNGKDVTIAIYKMPDGNTYKAVVRNDDTYDTAYQSISGFRLVSIAKDRQAIVCLPKALENENENQIDYQFDEKTTVTQYATLVQLDDQGRVIACRHVTWNALNAEYKAVMVESAKNELRKRYVYTSAAYVNHEDFSSYYPSLLRMMNAFFNAMLGYDRYGEIYLDKERFGRMMKDPNRSEEERIRLSLDRNGVKLILNTASGAGDAKFDNNVRMNNNIIAMRLIGQLFTWRIGQAQALKGASVPSTNTDGLYTVMEETENNKLLFEVADTMGVAIEPEVMHLVSKDANNRIEFAIEPASVEDAVIVHPENKESNNPNKITYGYAWFKTHDKSGNKLDASQWRWVPESDDIENDPRYEKLPAKFRVLSASGGDLACRRGPDVSKSLAHPAIMDWALSEYLMRVYLRNDCRQESMSEPFDPVLAKEIIEEAQAQKDVHAMLLFQNVIASNPNSMNFVFAQKSSVEQIESEPNDDPIDGDPPQILQHYNRTFIMSDKCPEELKTWHLWSAMGKTVSARMQESRRSKGEKTFNVKSRTADIVLTANMGITPRQDSAQILHRDVVRQKVNRVDPNWNILIENTDLVMMDQKRRELILENLDIDAYVTLVKNSYVNNWLNA